MFDIDFILIIWRDCHPDVSFLVLKNPSFYNFSFYSMKGTIFTINTISLYLGSLIIYAKMSAPIITKIVAVTQPIVTETIINNQIFNKPLNIDFINQSKNIAHKLMLDNKDQLLMVAFETITDMEEASSQILGNNIKLKLTFDQTALIFKMGLMSYIKSDPELYSKLLNNDFVVDYIVKLCYEGFINNNIPEALGFKPI